MKKKATNDQSVQSFTQAQVYSKKISYKIVNIFLPIFLAYVLGAQKKCLIEMVLLSTCNIFFG